MNILLKQILIYDPNSTHHGKRLDVLIRNGVYEQIAPSIEDTGDCRMMEDEGAMLMPGWFDMRVHFREPGEEQKETIRSGQEAAAAGGFTGVLLMPSTQPPLSTASDITSVRERSAGHAVEVFPAGVLTENRAGKELSGMVDMKQAGAVAFTDYKRYIPDAGVMLRCMQYAGNIKARVIAYAEEPGLSAGLMANESPATLRLGMKGIPPMAERMAIERDLNLVRYSGLPLHFSGVSTADAVKAIRIAKAEGLSISAEVYVAHLLLTDEALATFDSMYKMRPPLRSEEDVIALREAVLDGTIDVVCSDHCPQDSESKAVEFAYAQDGIIGLESFFGTLIKAFEGRLTPDHIYKLIVSNPRIILGLSIPQIEAGKSANATGFHPSAPWVFKDSDIRSRSGNSPFIGHTLQGKPLFVVNRGIILTS